MISYKALTSTSTILEALDETTLYESDIFSSNGSILYPYDLETTLTGVIYEDLKDGLFGIMIVVNMKLTKNGTKSTKAKIQ